MSNSENTKEKDVVASAVNAIICDYCGRFISHEDFAKQRAVSRMVTPESEVSQELIETYHIKCKENGKDT